MHILRREETLRKYNICSRRSACVFMLRHVCQAADKSSYSQQVSSASCHRFASVIKEFASKFSIHHIAAQECWWSFEPVFVGLRGWADFVFTVFQASKWVCFSRDERWTTEISFPLKLRLFTCLRARIHSEMTPCSHPQSGQTIQPNAPETSFL